MTYTLDAFIKDAKSALKTTDGPAGREKVRVLLEKLLTNQSFVDEAVGPAAPIGTRKLYEDKDQGFVVLAHCNPKPHKSPPHDHGSSWAVYGQAIKYTDMSEYKRLDGGNGAGEAKLEKVKSYRLEPVMPASMTSVRSMPSTIRRAAASFASPAAISTTCSG
jgi:hypothetical protein